MLKNKKIFIGSTIAVVIIAVVAVVCIFMFGSEKKKVSRQEETTVTETEAVTKDPNAGKVKSRLTGEYTKPSIANKRPVALMYNNIINAIPHSGLYNADVCYEAPVEGAITRIMGIFEDYEKVKKMGSVRSCRIYYCSFANEWDAVYSHFGQSKYALEYLKSGKIDTVSSLTGERYFFRTSDRVAPHNCFTSGANLKKAIKDLKYRADYKKDYKGHFEFAEADNKINLETGKTANRVDLGYMINKPYFVFNQKDGQYYRFQYGSKHIDDQNNKQLHCSNIIIQFVNATLYPDNKSLDMTLSGNGKGWFITNGKAEKITWQKSEQRSGQTKYLNENGEEIKLNTGKTWICMVQNEYADNVKISKKKK
ncbi:MAG: DUF3048 domain-containing protein [Eubacterium sp.]|nr:DUF3048 domain-containing protein [Eubacterium sp.]